VYDDRDIKIVGNFPSRDIKKNKFGLISEVNTGSMKRGAMLGSKIAEEYVCAVSESGPGAGQGSEEMLYPRNGSRPAGKGMVDEHL